jgi:GNAT superfamily N-acetyltransferase
MTATMRNFNRSTDFLAISDFLYTLYQPDNRDGNWFQPIWEYAYTHGMFDGDSVERIGVWEDDGSIVGVVLYESILGEAFFNIHPNYEHLKPEMLEYAEQHLIGKTDDGKRYLKAYVTDFDTAFESVVQSKGYEIEPRSHRPMSQFVITDPFPPIRLREGFKLKSLADDNNFAKSYSALWRGFNHPGEPPAYGIEERKKMQSGPHFRKDLTIVVEAPNGDFVAFSGLWFEPIHKFGYVEPVATDPDYRRMGLGTAAVLEGIRRCGELGATVAYVGTDKPFYLAMGFKKLFTLNCWIKYFPKPITK